jgi:membrane protease subunit (stomatin/prohibitin family)
MTQRKRQGRLPRRSLIAGLALMAATQPAWAIMGVWRRTAARTVVVASAATASASATANANASKEAAAAQSAQAAADASAAAKQAAASADKAAAQAQAAASTKTPQQKLAELQSLYDQKLISQSDYEAAKTKILNQVTQ